MKRIILLLLLLTCFRISYGEELSAEQQRLAWKFIYDKALSKDFHPIVFKDDIIINLKGKVTSEDSMVVKDIIKNFQVAIPHLKITLSNSPGNLILGLDFKKMTSITSNLNTFEILSQKTQFSLPDNLTSYQRKQFIYYWLCKGIVFFNYNKSSENILGLNGCVFAEEDFKSITFSPYDLFILEKLYSHDFSIQLAKNLSTEIQQTAWKSIQWQFMGKPNDPLIFNGNIFIKLAGNVSPKDSAIFKRTINELKELLPSENDFVFTDSDASLTFTINSPEVEFRKKLLDNGQNITIRELEINIPKNANDEQRTKIIYYYLYRSLVHFSPAYGGSQKVPGCVFDEDKPEDITFHPIDKFIVSKLYAPDFQDQFKTYFVKASSLREYYKFRYSNRLATIGISGGLMLSILLISILIILNVFRKHNWKFRSFLIQVIWGIIAFNVFFLFNNLVQGVGFRITQISLITIFCEDLTILIVAIASFFIEKRIHFSSLSPKGKSILLLVDTIVLSYIFLFIFLRFITKESGYNLMFLPIFISLIITISRFFMISLSGLSRAEIKQKDNELILLKEKNKQAELQSLRAKINPHFLYNALNSIASLATTDARKTEQMALALSDFFKYAINREQKQLNTLSEELNAIRTYLEIEKVRFGDRLSFEIDCPEELLNIQIPQLLIQPLVENAIKHGLSQITENGLIRISVSKTENQLKIRVYDNGPAFPDGPLTGFGIQNTQERIALLYGEKASVNWVNGAEKYIELNLPSVNEPI